LLSCFRADFPNGSIVHVKLSLTAILIHFMDHLLFDGPTLEITFYLFIEPEHCQLNT